MILYDYEYDFISQQFFSQILDQNSGELTLEFTVPSGMRLFSGFGIKLSKAGEPGPIRFVLRAADNGRRVAEGVLNPDEVTPVFETFVQRRFPAVEAKQGDRFLLSLTAEEGLMPLDGYRIFGPLQHATSVFDGADQPPYWWEESYCGEMAVPKEYKPAAAKKSMDCRSYSADGTIGPGFSLELCTDEEKDKGQQHFEFVRRVTAPPYSEWEGNPFSDCGRIAQSGDEVWIDAGWSIDWDRTSGFARRLAEEMKAFFLLNFGFELNGGERHIVIHTGSDKAPEGAESHTIDAESNRICIHAADERGVMRALHFLQDMMLEKRSPAVKKGTYRRRCLYGLRMGNGLYPAPYNYFPLQCPEIWTEGYLWRISRAGYNAIWMIMNIEEMVISSRVFPEMADANAAVALERLRRITEKAERFGVDVHVELRTGYYKPFPEAVYERMPHIRSFPKWGNYPCTGSPEFKEFLNETLTVLLTKVPELKGLMVIYDTEGFFSCFTHNRQEHCPICRGKSSEQLAYDFFRELSGTVSASGSKAGITAWTYFCDEPWNYRLLENLPPNIKVMACYSQFMEFERFGAVSRTDDYACCVTGPSDYFRKVKSIVWDKGLELVAKTEVSFGQEFVATPYIPCMQQHQKRWNALRQEKVTGFMGDYIHWGFTPSPCTDLMRVNIFETRLDDKELFAGDEGLEWVASLNYGRPAAKRVLKAWALFSEAVASCFPYSPGVCRYPGPLQAAPSQPFHIDPEKKVQRKRARYNAQDLSWTKLAYKAGYGEVWDEALVYRCFKQFSSLYRQGICLLEEAQDDGAAERDKLEGLARVAGIQVHMVESMINFIDFVVCREKLDSDGERKKLYHRMLELCEREAANCSAALELCRADSRLGFGCEGQGTVRGGYFNAETIRDKLSRLPESAEWLKERIIEGVGDTGG